MYELYQDVANIRKPDSHMIMVGNGKLIKHTGDIHSQEIQSLVGRAIQKKYLTMEDASGSKSLSQGALKKHEGFTLKYGKNGQIDKQIYKPSEKESIAQKKSDHKLTKKEKKKLKKDEDTGANIPSCLNALEATAIVHHDGKINGCQSNYAKEWQSLALVGKFALESNSNLKAADYASDHKTEESLGLKIAHWEMINIII